MAKIYYVELTDDERACLLNLIKTGHRSARKVTRAHILLLSATGKNDPEVAEALHTSVSTVQRTRQRFVEGGLDKALNEAPRLGGQKNRRLDEKGEAILVELATSAPPEGRTRWTLHLLGDRLVELHVVERISHEVVRQVLKKRGLSLV